MFWFVEFSRSIGYRLDVDGVLEGQYTPRLYAPLIKSPSQCPCKDLLHLKKSENLVIG